MSAAYVDEETKRALLAANAEVATGDVGATGGV